MKQVTDHITSNFCKTALHKFTPFLNTLFQVKGVDCLYDRHIK